MDELLTFMEEDLAYDDDDNPDPRAPDPSCSRISLSPLKSRNSLSAQEKKSQDVTFKDIFGSPDKRDIKELGLLSSGPAPAQSSSNSSSSRRKLDSGPSPSGLSSRLSSSQLSSSFSQSSSGSSQAFELGKQIRQDKNVPYKPDSSLVVIDSYSRVRLVKSSISIYFDETVTAEAVLKERNIGLEYVSLPTFSTWYRGKGKDTKNFWISGVLTRKTSGVRKSAKGNDYTIWEVNDLKDLEKHYTVFLFGTASSASTLVQIPVGSLVDLVTPSVLQDAASSTIKFSINNATQVRFIATAKDFGICSAKKKDGNKCTAVVNIWECSFCIHHASKELKKLNVGGVSSRKGKGRGGNGNGNQFPNKSFSGFEESQSQESLRQQGVFIANFGGPPAQNKTQKATTSKPILSSRMSLQGATNEMKKNPLKWGNPDTVTFVKDGGDHRLLPKEAVPPPVRKPLDLNPMKTRHLTDRDRDLLKMLDSKMQSTNKPNISDSSSSQETAKISKQSGKGSAEISELITTSIVNNPNAASRNFLQFLTLQHAPKDQVDLESSQKTSKIVPLVMSREKVKSMAKALDFVKNNGPIKKVNPNASSGTKRKLQSQSSSPGKKRSSKTATTKIDVEFDFDHESEDFKRILNAKSAHDDELDQIQHEEYFGKLEKKEELENKLLSTFSIETSAVMCRQCKYVALSQSEYCKEQMHQVRMVKARKRFFKCKDCGNRAMSLDRLPKRPCSVCNNSSWLVAPVGRERKGPTLPSEMLAVRGNEEKFVGSAGSKMFLHLEA